MDKKQLTEKLNGMKRIILSSKASSNIAPFVMEYTKFLEPIYKDRVVDGLRVFCVRNEIYDEDSIPKCCICGDYSKLITRNMRFSDTCSSPTCQNEKRQKEYEETCMERFGTDNGAKVKENIDKRRETYQERYGTDHPMRNADIVKTQRSTMKERYGDESYLRTEAGKAHVDSIIRERYGVDNIMHHPHYKQIASEKFKAITSTPEWRERMSKIMREKYKDPDFYQAHIKRTGSTTNFSLEVMTRRKNLHERTNGLISILEDKETLQEYMNSHGVYVLAEYIGVHAQTVYNRAHKFGIEIKTPHSAVELQLVRMFKDLGIKVVHSDQSILSGRKEIDIYLPEYNLAIEYNGLNWHTDQYIPNTQHLDKTRECLEKGIQLIHIMEDEWLERREQVISKLKHLVGKDDSETVYARKTKPVESNNKDVKDFYDDNHIQGHANATKVFTLLYDDTIVAAMSLKVSGDTAEITRYATSKHVVGGFSKLFSFVKKFMPEIKTFTSFADRRWSTGNMYQKVGFELVKTTRPDYQYVVGKKRVRKQHFRHNRKLKDLPNYDPNLSENENTKNHGIYRIYDCGLLKFQFTR